MTLYCDSILIGVIAYVYAVILTDQEMILNRPFVWLRDRIPDWLFKPLMGCVYCVAGQMGLWYYLIKFWDDYNFLNHICFVSVSIFTIEVILILNKLNDKN